MCCADKIVCLKLGEGNRVKYLFGAVTILIIVCTVTNVLGQDEKAEKTSKKSKDPLSFKGDVFPIIQKYCLPCHAEDSFNPSELSMDSYDQLMTGGKHGVPIIVSKSKESILIQKIGMKPPFGDRMPLNTKKKISEGTAKWLSEEEIKTITEWVDQGGKNN